MPKRTNSSHRSRVSVQETRDAVLALVVSNQPDAALKVLELALGSARNVPECEAVADVFDLVPDRWYLSSPAWCATQAKALCFARRPQRLIEIAGLALDRWGEAALSVRPYLAWALSRDRERADTALEIADAVIASGEGFSSAEFGLAWRSRAEALAWLEGDGWLEAFARARGLLTGRSLGTCLIAEGFHLDRRHQAVQARRAWSEAAAVLTDAYYGAWVQYNLGMSFLKDALPQAESYFLSMERLTRRGVGAAFAARAWCGVGASRRVLGEWVRAENAYRTATRLAREPEDALEAWRGLGHTLRLARDPLRAHEALHRALGFDPTWLNTRRSWVMVDVAAARLLMEDNAGALEALGQASAEDQDDRDRERIVRAECHRRAGDVNAVLESLRGVQFDALCAREEHACFPELFALVAATRGPAPLERSVGTVVDVRAIGVLHVRVNARDVPIPPTSIMGEVLVLLLEGGGEASTEVLLDRLYANQSVTRRAKQALSRQVRFLRDALGWAGSVIELGGAYRLDPTTTWRYDVREAREAGASVSRFLEGVYRDWALETALELNASARDLN